MIVISNFYFTFLYEQYFDFLSVHDDDIWHT